MGAIDTRSDADVLKQLAIECDGCEVFETEWATAELVVASDSRFILGPSRGPSRAWKRLYLKDGEEA